MRSAVHGLALALSLLWIAGAAMVTAAPSASSLAQVVIARDAQHVAMPGCTDCDGRTTTGPACQNLCAAPAAAILPGTVADALILRHRGWTVARVQARGRASPPVPRPPNSIL